MPRQTSCCVSGGHKPCKRNGLTIFTSSLQLPVDITGARKNRLLNKCVTKLVAAVGGFPPCNINGLKKKQKIKILGCHLADLQTATVFLHVTMFRNKEVIVVNTTPGPLPVTFKNS